MIESDIIHITDVAIDKFKEMIFDSGSSESYLRISIELDGTKMYYNLDVIETPFEGDSAHNYSGLNVLINEEDKDLLKGTVIDYISDDLGDNFVIDNPNLITELEDDGGTGGCGCGCGYC